MATDASDAERRRIARDLHDGVVQDLAGTSFALSGLAREVENRSNDEQRTQLEQLAASARSSLMSLRSLLVEIYPPELAGAGLAAALQDLVAPAKEASVTVQLDVTDVDDLPDEVTALIWRTAQECVRNALRHGQPSQLHIDVHVEDAGHLAVMSVSDNGRGFDTTEPLEGDHFGLRGLRDLARESGGSLDVRSAHGEGTEATLRVPVR
jgi:signal transduction histidine kinase